MSDSHEELAPVIDRLAGHIVVDTEGSDGIEANQERNIIPADAIAHSDRKVITYRTVDFLDKGGKMSLGAVEYLIVKYFEGQYGNSLPSLSIPHSDENIDYDTDTFKPDVQREKELLDDDIGYHPVIKQGEFTHIDIDGPIYDGDDGDDDNSVKYALVLAFRTLSQEDQLQAVRWFFDTYADSGVSDIDIAMLFSSMINKANSDERGVEGRAELYAEALRFILKKMKEPQDLDDIVYDDATPGFQDIRQLDDLSVSASDEPRDFGDPVHDLIWDIQFFRPGHPAFFTALTHLEPDERNIILAEFLKMESSFAGMLDKLREALTDNSLDDQHRAKLEQMGKLLLGFDEDDERPFHACLSEVYENTDLSEYEGYASTQEYELKLLENVIGDHVGERIVDIGCGDARVARELARRTGNSVLGIDVDEGEVLKARIAIEADGLGDKVEVKAGDMHRIAYVPEDALWVPKEGRLNIEPGSVGCVYTLGRTLMHDVSKADITNTMREMSAILHEGGEWVFDLPNPNVGNMLALRERSATICNNLGMTVERIPNPDIPDTDMPAIEVIIDSPDGKNFYNRRLFQFDQIEAMLEKFGFELEILDTVPLKGSSYTEDDRNVYFRATKVSSPRLWQTAQALFQAMPDSTKPESYEQWEDDE